jgi:hypothetical protein
MHCSSCQKTLHQVYHMQDTLTKVGKKLRKSNVSVDVVSFGDCAEANKEKLEAFIAAVNKDANSHYVEAPAGSNLCDFLLSSPIVSQGGGGEGEGGEGGEGAGELLCLLLFCLCSGCGR